MKTVKFVCLAFMLTSILSVCLAQKSKDNQKKYGKNELPEAMESNLELESKMVETMNRYAKANGWKETFKRAIITSEWKTVRNEWTGLILKRVKSAYLCASWPDGHCTYQLFTFGSDYNGSEYSGRIYRAGTGGQTTVWCSKLKKE